MAKVIKQILELDKSGKVKLLILEICPNSKNKVLYKSQDLIFHPITADFKPTDIELVEFNDFLVNEISRAKRIIPTFKQFFDGEVNLIIPNELQTITTGIKELKLYSNFEGKYWINDNLLKGFKEEILDQLKVQLSNETITNFNFTELVINNQSYKIKSRLKDLEVGVSHLDVKYRLTTIKKTLSDSLVKTINNLKLKVVYIWSQQDLLSFKITQERILANHSNEKLLIVDWDDDCMWITTDYFNSRKTFKVDLGMNNLYQLTNEMLSIPQQKSLLIKNYLTNSLDLMNHQFDQLNILKLKTSNQRFNLFQLKELKVKLIQGYLKILMKLEDRLTYQQGIKDLGNYRFFHFGKINEITNFANFIQEVMFDNEQYLKKHLIYQTNNDIGVVGVYQHSYENLFILGEWMKNRLEKAEYDRKQQILKQQTYILNQERMVGNQNRSRANYNKQKFPIFNEKIDSK